jgi:hypothetical protein
MSKTIAELKQALDQSLATANYLTGQIALLEEQEAEKLKAEEVKKSIKKVTEGK